MGNTTAHRHLWLSVLALAIMLYAPTASADLAVHFIDVGQGDAVLIECDEYDQWALIDAGDRFRDPVAKLRSYLESQDVDAIHLLMATHPHADHIGGMSMILEEFTVLLVADSGYEATSALWRDYKELLMTTPIPVIFPRRGDVIQLGNLELEVLHPSDPVDRYANENNASIVIRLEYGDVSFLFTGDVEALGESEMLSELGNSASELLDVDILKVAHHGSRTSSSEAFLSVVTPEVAVISVGEGNRYGLPDEEALHALAEVGAEVYRTDHHGTVVIWTDGSQYSVTTECNTESVLH
ncbi:MAG: MBL fold metallo-hydrolase [Clostridiaceae bacterium]|nr:MBL fold metallo-hydrolase [Clostridiaceae bacterium]